MIRWFLNLFRNPDDRASVNFWAQREARREGDLFGWETRSK